MSYLNRRGQWVNDENDGYLDQKARQVGGGISGVIAVALMLFIVVAIGYGILELAKLVIAGIGAIFG